MVMRLVAQLKRMQTLGVVVAFLLLVSASFAILSAAGNGRPGSSGPPARQTSTAQSTTSTRPAPAATLASACVAGSEGVPSVASVDGMQLPLPPGTTVGQSIWGYQPNGSYNSPFIRTPLCTKGVSQATLLAYMRKQMPIYSWTATSADGTAWNISTVGISPLVAR